MLHYLLQQTSIVSTVKLPSHRNALNLATVFTVETIKYSRVIEFFAVSKIDALKVKFSNSG